MTRMSCIAWPYEGTEMKVGTTFLDIVMGKLSDRKVFGEKLPVDRKSAEKQHNVSSMDQFISLNGMRPVSNAPGSFKVLFVCLQLAMTLDVE